MTARPPRTPMLLPPRAPAARPVVVLPFGKHVGVPLDRVPIGYLCWLMRAGIVRSPQLAAAVDHVHLARCGQAHVPEDDEDEPWR